MGKMIRTGIKYIFKRKAKGMERKFAELIELSKLNELIKKDEKEERCGKVWKIVGICVAAAAVIGGIAFLLYRFFGYRTDDYDLYDDLDNYYVEEDGDKDQPVKVPEDDLLDKGLDEADFAE